MQVTDKTMSLVCLTIISLAWRRYELFCRNPSEIYLSLSFPLNYCGSWIIWREDPCQRRETKTRKWETDERETHTPSTGSRHKSVKPMILVLSVFLGQTKDTTSIFLTNNSSFWSTSHPLSMSRRAMNYQRYRLISWNYTSLAIITGFSAGPLLFSLSWLISAGGGNILVLILCPRSWLQVIEEDVFVILSYCFLQSLFSCLFDSCFILLFTSLFSDDSNPDQYLESWWWRKHLVSPSISQVSSGQISLRSNDEGRAVEEAGQIQVV